MPDEKKIAYNAKQIYSSFKKTGQRAKKKEERKREREKKKQEAEEIIALPIRHPAFK